LDYGRSDYDVGKAFKIFGLWQPVFFHGSHSWIEKIAGQWSLSGIFNIHSGFPFTPVTTFSGSLYYGTWPYNTVFPSTYLGGAGTSTSNDAFRTVAQSNFPNGGAAYFFTPAPPAFSGTDFGTAVPQSPGVRRNSLNLPGYRSLDVSVIKGFGLPNAPVLGENGRIELRMDAYNVFNNLNFNPNMIQNNVGSSPCWYDHPCSFRSCGYPWGTIQLLRRL